MIFFWASVGHLGDTAIGGTGEDVNQDTAKGNVNGVQDVLLRSLEGNVQNNIPGICLTHKVTISVTSAKNTCEFFDVSSVKFKEKFIYVRQHLD